MEALTGKTSTVDYTGITALMNEARPKLFGDFPIYNESHRTTLQNLIMGHYLLREIATTPYAQWQFMFNQKLNEIMPYYNELYELKAQALRHNLFDDTEYKRDSKRDKTLTMEKGTKDVSTVESMTQDNATFTPGTTSITTEQSTPQGELENFLDNKYMSGATKATISGDDISSGDSTSNGTSTTTRSGTDVDTDVDTFSETVKGKMGGRTFAELMSEYRKEIYNIDTMIINDLETMFFSIY